MAVVVLLEVFGCDGNGSFLKIVLELLFSFQLVFGDQVFESCEHSFNSYLSVLNLQFILDCWTEEGSDVLAGFFDGLLAEYSYDFLMEG